VSLLAPVLRGDFVIHDRREVRVKIVYGGIADNARLTVSVSARSPLPIAPPDHPPPSRSP
jgi:hypothetical protein